MLFVAERQARLRSRFAGANALRSYDPDAAAHAQPAIAKHGAQGRNRTRAYPIESSSLFEQRLSSVPTSVPGAFFAAGRVRLCAAIPKSCAYHVRIVSSAPVGTHLRTRFDHRSIGQNRFFQHILATFDPDLRVIDLDDVNQRAKVGLPERSRSRRQVFAHCAAKGFRLSRHAGPLARTASARVVPDEAGVRGDYR